jgi:hypothetical protein
MGLGEGYRIDIADLMGRLVLSKHLEGGSVKIETSLLGNRGCYLLLVYDDQGYPAGRHKLIIID